MNPTLLSLLSVLVFAVTSCVDQDSIYTMNGDGSGKVEHSIKIRKAGGDWTEDEPAKSLALNVIRGAEGIEAWDDVNYRLTDGGVAVEARMTGYFTDVNAVDLGGSIDREGKETRIPIPRLTWEESGDSEGVFSIKDSGPEVVNPQMKITVNGKTSEPDKDEADEADFGSAMGDIAQTKFAFDSTYRLEIRINGSMEDSQGVEVADDGESAVYEYKLVSKADATPEQVEKIGAAVKNEGLLDNGIHENAALQSALFDRNSPFTVKAKIEKSQLDVQAAISAAEFQVNDKKLADELDGWTKLESLEDR